jgi:hypothetical protein
MTEALDIAETLRHHGSMCRELLTVVEQESQALREPEGRIPAASNEVRQRILPQLHESVQALQVCRAAWQAMNARERSQHPAVPPLLRQNQDLVMKIIVLDRENEQSRLRRGLLPPHRLPPANRQRPHFVTDLYRRASTT